MDLRAKLVAAAEDVTRGRKAGASRGCVAAVVQHGDEEGLVSVELDAGLANEVCAARLGDALVSHGVRVVWAGLGAQARGDRLPLDNGGSVTLQLTRRQDVPDVHITQNLERARQLSEEGVLTIGREMAGVSTLAREHMQSLGDLSQQFSESSTNSVAANVVALTQQVRDVRNDLIDRAERQVHGVKRAQEWTAAIMRLGQAITDIAASARILTFNARVESARIGEQGKGFAVIAQAVQDLAAQIRTANQSVTAIVRQLATALPELQSEAQGIATTITRDTQRLEDQLAAVNLGLDAARIASSDGLARNSLAAAQMHARVETVLEAMQFQDRASQLLVEAAAQCDQVLAFAGLTELELQGHDVHQVGALGRQVEAADVAAAGSVILM
jgi:hypothetical protein